ncbi:MAG TPA: hypothetical protein VKA46_31040 [Gemmataceae bacterium]|nr:hypothetical protein [Gemmataceae bacterium]
MTLPAFLSEWPGNEIVLTGYRINLYAVVSRYNEGYSPEGIVDYYDTVPLDLVRKVVAFYLENKAAVDEYVAEYDAELARQAAQGSRIDFDALLKRFAERYPERAREIARTLGKADPTCP